MGVQTKETVGIIGRRRIWSCFCHVHDVEDGINPCHVLESEILMIENHPLITMLQRHFLDVGKHADRHDNLTAIGKQHAELATHIEVEALDSYCQVGYLAHNIFVV